MAIELKIPEIGESITEVEIGGWLKKPGDKVVKDEPLVTLESDKATVELPSPEAGTIQKVLKQQGEVAKIGEVIAYLEGNGKSESKPAAPKSAEPPRKPAVKEEEKPAAQPEPRVAPEKQKEKPRSQRQFDSREAAVTAEEEKSLAVPDEPVAENIAPVADDNDQPAAHGQSSVGDSPNRDVEKVPMSRLRRTVAERLVNAQRNAALLTTFNEIDMSQVMALRSEYGEVFQKKHGVKLGFMSFFVKAVIDGLKQFPALNAEIQGTDVVYHNYHDIGVAIGSGKGLVVPVLRNAERLSFAEVESAIGDFARRARDNRLKPDELQGGTFTISNGGVYGSLLSTPIVNPPQSGVLGMHTIQDRPVAIAGNVVIRPMMYVALTYDHRLVDGREAVTFLKRVREAIENPARMLIEI